MTVLLKQKVKKSSVAIWTWLFEISVSSWFPPSLSPGFSVSMFFKSFRLRETFYSPKYLRTDNAISEKIRKKYQDWSVAITLLFANRLHFLFLSFKRVRYQNKFSLLERTVGELMDQDKAQIKQGFSRRRRSSRLVQEINN